MLLTTLSHNYTYSLQSHLTTGYVIQLSKDHARKRYKYVTTEEQLTTLCNIPMNHIVSQKLNTNLKTWNFDQSSRLTNLLQILFLHVSQRLKDINYWHDQVISYSPSQFITEFNKNSSENEHVYLFITFKPAKVSFQFPLFLYQLLSSFAK